MDHITKKLVETVNRILAEGAPRGGAAIFAGMSDAQFEAWVAGNPGGAEKARALRAQGQGRSPSSSRPQPTSPTSPARPQNTKSAYTPHTVSAPEHESEKFFTSMVDEWAEAKNTNPEGINNYTRSVLEKRAGTTKDAALHEKLINHPEWEMRSWALQNPLTTSQHIDKLLKDPELHVIHSAIRSKAFSADNMKTLFDTSLSGMKTNERRENREKYLDHYHTIKRAMYEHPHLYTSDMHQTLSNHENPQLRSLAAGWVKQFSEPERQQP